MTQTQLEVHDLFAIFFSQSGWPAGSDQLIVAVARYVEEKVEKATAPNATSAK
jgi:hypothetical protein